MPKHIFLIHGEEDSQVVLKGKILEQVPNMDVQIPEYGQEFNLDDSAFSMEQRFTNPQAKDIDKIELMDKMQKLEVELQDMRHSLKEDIRLSTTSDEDMAKLNKRVNDLRKQIIQIMGK